MKRVLNWRWCSDLNLYVILSTCDTSIFRVLLLNLNNTRLIQTRDRRITSQTLTLIFAQVVEGKHTVYRMSASTEEEKDDWIKCIQWVDLARLVKSSPPIATIFLILVSLRLHGASLDRTRVLMAKLLQTVVLLFCHKSFFERAKSLQ